MAVTQYVGSRYVPLFADPAEWSAANAYEALTIVLHNGNSFTSRQPVPPGIDISNESYWAQTGNYNAQIEQYRRDTARAMELANEVGEVIPKGDFSASNTVKSYIDTQCQIAIDVANEAQADINALLPKHDFSAENTIKRYIDGQDATIAEIINNKAPFNYGFVGFARNKSTDESDVTSIIWSDDFENINVLIPKVNNVSDGTHYLSDSCKLARIGKWWYATAGGGYFKSQDLVNWELGQNSFENPWGLRCWAGTIAQLKNDEYIYITSVEYSSDPTVGYYYNASTYFVIAYAPITIDANGEIVFGAINYLNVCNNTTKETSYIDPSLVYNPITDSYFFAAKNEINSQIEFYVGANINSLAKRGESSLRVIEAPCLVFDGLNVTMTCERYVRQSAGSSGFFGYTLPTKQQFYHVPMSQGTVITSGFNFRYTKSQGDFRHVTYIPCDDETYAKLIKASDRLLKGMGFVGNSLYETHRADIVAKSDATDLTRLLENTPNILYAFGANSPSSITVEMLKAFDSIEPFRLINPRGTTYTVTLGSSFRNAGTVLTMSPGSWLEMIPVYATSGCLWSLHTPTI